MKKQVACSTSRFIRSGTIVSTINQMIDLSWKVRKIH